MAETTLNLRSFSKIFILLLVLHFIPQYGFSQDRRELEKEKQENIDKIKYTRSLLDRTKKRRSNSLEQLKLLEQTIRNREQLIKNLESEYSLLEKETEKLEKNLKENEKELQHLKDEYARIIKNSYRNIEEENVWMYILSSEDFNQAYQRIKYIKYLNDYRRQTVDRIISMNDSLLNAKEEILIRQKEMQASIKNMEEEQRQLVKNRKEKNSAISNLKNREQELMAELKKREKIRNQLEDEIRKIIEEEARKAREANRTMRLTPEEKLVSENFVNNRGHLPWPTEQGIITGRFGEHPHPVLPGIKVRSNGIDISTTPGANVRTIFEGEVTKVIAILGANYTVIIKHGNYRTVYQNLVEVKVKAGDHLETREYIGKAGKSEEDVSRVHFQVWDAKEPVDPERWLSR